MHPITNPYRKMVAPPVELPQGLPGTQIAMMGPQSQRRLTLKSRTHQLQSQSLPRKKMRKHGVGQQTLFGQRAFDPKIDCVVCKAKLWGRQVHRAHHQLCYNNRRTKSVTSEASLALKKEEKRLNLLAAPLAVEEQFSSRNLTKDSQNFFCAETTGAEQQAESITSN